MVAVPVQRLLRVGALVQRPTAIGNGGRTGELAGDGIVAGRRRRVGEHGQQVHPVPVRRQIAPEGGQHGGVDVHVLHQLVTPLAVAQLGMVDDERDHVLGRELVRLQLADAAVVAVEGAVVGVHDHHGVAPQVEFVHGVQHLAQPAVGQHHLAGVARLEAEQLVFVHVFAPPRVGRVAGPVGGVVAARVELAQDLLRRIPRFVRVEFVDLEIETAVAGVAAQPLGGGAEGARHRHVLLAVAEAVFVAPVAFQLGGQVGRRAVERVVGGGPRVLLLAADELEAGEPEVVVAGARAPHVLVVGDEVADHVVRAVGGDRMAGARRQQARQIEVAFLQRPPAALRKLVAAGVDVAPRRHARRAARVGALEHRAARRQPVQVGRRHHPVRLLRRVHLVERPALVIGPAVIAAQGVAEDVDHVHGHRV